MLNSRHYWMCWTAHERNKNISFGCTKLSASSWSSTLLYWSLLQHFLKERFTTKSNKQKGTQETHQCRFTPLFGLFSQLFHARVGLTHFEIVNELIAGRDSLGHPNIFFFLHVIGTRVVKKKQAADLMTSLWGTQSRGVRGHFSVILICKWSF